MHEDIIHFQIIQKERNLFEILIVADVLYFNNIRDVIEQKLTEKFPKEVTIHINRAETIEPDATGKPRRFISEVKD